MKLKTKATIICETGIVKLGEEVKLLSVHYSNSDDLIYAKVSNNSGVVVSANLLDFFEVMNEDKSSIEHIVSENGDYEEVRLIGDRTKVYSGSSISSEQWLDLIKCLGANVSSRVCTEEDIELL